jgi:ubiquinone/menaquinone biosynthesis C-methylase UbiE
MSVLDVGAGTGALTDELITRGATVSAVEPSPDYAAGLLQRIAEVHVAPAEEIPLPDGAFDAVLAQLVVVFLNDVAGAVREMTRVARAGGVVATCMWEVQGMDVMNALNAVRDRLAPGTAPEPVTRYRDEASLRQLFAEAGLREVETATLEVQVTYQTVDELWEPAVHVGGPGGPVADRLTPEQLAAGRAAFEEELGSPTAAFELRGRAAAVRGVTG